MAFSPIIAAAELWDGDTIARRVEGLDVLLVRLNGFVYAYENRCAHQGVALSEGRLEGNVLTCRAHHWQYDVRFGSGINPATACQVFRSEGRGWHSLRGCQRAQP